MAKKPAESFSATSPSDNAAAPSQQTTRRRRKSSGLGGDPPGDNAAPAFATTANRLNLQPLSPTSRSAEAPSKKGRKRRKVKGWLRRYWRFSLRHTWLNPLIIMTAVLAAFAVNPTPSNPVYPAVMLSYPQPRKAGDRLDAPTLYGKGAKDFAFVSFYIVVLSFTREFFMQRLIRPLAIKGGIRSRAKQSRFMEQFYTAIYFGIFGPFGLYVMSRSPVWYFNTTGMYQGFPHMTHDALFKAYYLLQASYWAQQFIVLVLMLEAPRKDFKELVAHHIITISLIWLSYRFHFTYMGIAVYITHDISDFFLASSKIINYLDMPVVGPFFAFFISIWTYLRHYTNIRILISMFPLSLPELTRWLLSLLPAPMEKAVYASPTLSKITEPIFPNWHSEFSTVGPYEVDWANQQYKCWISNWITFSLLGALQAVNLFWLFFIIRIAVRYIRTGEEKDDRSEYEESEAEDDDAKGTKEKDVKKLEGPTVLLNGNPLLKTSSDHSTEQPIRRSPRKKTARAL